MSRKRHAVAVASCLFFLVLSGCAKEQVAEVEVLRSHALDSLDGLITQFAVLDTEVSADGNGSLKIVASETMTIPLFETGDIDIENAGLTYQAKLRTENLDGKAFLEMWCQFEDEGDYFSRGLDSALSGTNEWTTLETPFFLKAGENPNNVKLHVVVDGIGTVWIDDIKLTTGPLE